MGMVEIKASKALLAIDEQVLWKHLPQEELKKALERGKGIKRRRQQKVREKERELQRLVGEWLQALDTQQQGLAVEVAREIQVIAAELV